MCWIWRAIIYTWCQLLAPNCQNEQIVIHYYVRGAVVLVNLRDMSCLGTLWTYVSSYMHTYMSWRFLKTCFYLITRISSHWAVYWWFHPFADTEIDLCHLFYYADFGLEVWTPNAWQMRIQWLPYLRSRRKKILQPLSNIAWLYIWISISCQSAVVCNKRFESLTRCLVGAVRHSTQYH